MTNVDELFGHLTDLGQHPKEKSDTITIIEKIGHFLDEENINIYQKYRGDFSKIEISRIRAVSCISIFREKTVKINSKVKIFNQNRV